MAGLPTAAGGPDTDRMLGNGFTLWLGHPKKAVRDACLAAYQVVLSYPPRGAAARKAEGGRQKAATANEGGKDLRIPHVRFLVRPRPDGKKGVHVVTLNLLGAEVEAVGLNEKAALKTVAQKIFEGNWDTLGTTLSSDVGKTATLGGVLKKGFEVEWFGSGTGQKTATERHFEKEAGNGEPDDLPELFTLWPEQTADRWLRERDQAAMAEYTRLTPIQTERATWRARLATLGVEGVQTREEAVARRQGDGLTEYQRQQRDEILRRKEEEGAAAQAALEAARQDQATAKQQQAAKERQAQRVQNLDPLTKQMLEIAQQDANSFQTAPEPTKGLKGDFLPPGLEGEDLEPLEDLGGDDPEAGPDTRVKPGTTEESKGRLGQLRAQLAESEL